MSIRTGEARPGFAKDGALTPALKSTTPDTAGALTIPTAIAATSMPPVPTRRRRGVSSGGSPDIDFLWMAVTSSVSASNMVVVSFTPEVLFHSSPLRVLLFA